jgi:toxin ParE1/3/4
VTYRLTPRAVNDIAAIADYLNERNPAAAAKLISDFIGRFEMLARHPYAGPPRDDILPGLRHLVLGSHIAFYRAEDGDAVILRILHGRQQTDEQDVS